jgi:serine/threonine kinase 32
LYVIGKGGFGKVWKVIMKRNKKHYAIKEMSKAKIMDKKSEKAIKYEKELLSKIKHPYLYLT